MTVRADRRFVRPRRRVALAARAASVPALARTALACLVVLLAACASPGREPAVVRPPAEVRAQLLSLLPETLAEREAWAADIQSAFQLLRITPSTENLCAVMAVNEQESGYKVDPEVPGLGRIAREEIDRRAARLKIPGMLVSAALRLEAPGGGSYATRIAAVRTEKQLSELFDAFLAQVPLGQRLFGRINPVRTGGSMQVSIDFAEAHAGRHGYPYPHQGSIREEVFSRRGGLYFGIAHLLQYPNSYQRHLYRFADFNAGWYASRNAAFQAAVTAASGVKLALDGDLVLHGRAFGDDPVGATEAAVRSLGPAIGMSDRQVRHQLEQGDRFGFEETELYARVFALAEQRAGRQLPRAVMPQIRLESPKITRRLTTEWFATRVQQRYQRCVNRAFGAG